MKKLLRTALLMVVLAGSLIVAPVSASAHGSCTRSASPIQESLQDLTTTATVSCAEGHYRITVSGRFQVKSGSQWNGLGLTSVNTCLGTGTTSCSVPVGPTGCASVPGFPTTDTYRVQVSSLAQKTSGGPLTHNSTSYVRQTSIFC